VVQVLMLLEGLRTTVPFEVQTLFYRIWQEKYRSDPGMRDLARRMGFEV
jgi:hypothetical protein